MRLLSPTNAFELMDGEPSVTFRQGESSPYAFSLHVKDDAPVGVHTLQFAAVVSERRSFTIRGLVPRCPEPPRPFRE